MQLDEGSVYTVVSQRPARHRRRAARRRTRPHVPPSIQRSYAAPPVTTDRVRALAAQVTANAPTTYDKVRALEAWMGANTEYTLDIPPLPDGEDAVDQFLFVDQQGFCEQIGTSLVVMLRSLGIPARLAVGYATGERNPFTGLYEVRAKDAHAWAEVYFPGIGWQGFDPTAERAARRRLVDRRRRHRRARLPERPGRSSRRGRRPRSGSSRSRSGWCCSAGSWSGAAAAAGTGSSRAGPRPAWPSSSGSARGAAAPERPGETTPEYAAALARLDPFAEPQLAGHRPRPRRGDVLAARAGGAEDRAAVDEALADLAERWRRTRPRRKPALVGS